MAANRVVVIGCGDAGLSAAFAALKEGAELTVVSEEKFWYPRCPLPYYIGGSIERSALVRPLENIFKGSGARLVFDRAIRIGGGRLVCAGCELEYDRAVIATGARARRNPPFMSLRGIEDADKIKRRLREKSPVIVGAGMLGCELADAAGGTLIELKERILPAFDPEFSEAVAAKLSERVDIRTGTDKIPESDFVVSAAGVVPETELAEKSGIKTSEFGILVDSHLRTSMEGIYAAGDCIEEKCLFTKRPIHSYLGPQSERQGVIAGKNAAGASLEYSGSLNAVVAKIAGYEIGMTGLSSEKAGEAGMKITFGRVRAKTKPDYDKNAKELLIKMIFDGERLVGCMAMGGEGVEGIINLASYAMQHGAGVDDMISLAYCYSPTICSAPNPLVLCAENARRRMRR